MDREESVGGDSSTQAEGKHDFTVHMSKTPRLGIHMKTSARLIRNNAAPKLSNNVLPTTPAQKQLQLLSVPKLHQIQSSGSDHNNA